MLGRTVGVAFGAPALYFAVRGRLSTAAPGCRWRVVGLFSRRRLAGPHRLVDGALGPQRRAVGGAAAREAPRGARVAVPPRDAPRHGVHDVHAAAVDSVDVLAPPARIAARQLALVAPPPAAAAAASLTPDAARCRARAARARAAAPRRRRGRGRGHVHATAMSGAFVRGQTTLAARSTASPRCSTTAGRRRSTSSPSSSRSGATSSRTPRPCSSTTVLAGATTAAVAGACGYARALRARRRALGRAADREPRRAARGRRHHGRAGRAGRLDAAAVRADPARRGPPGGLAALLTAFTCANALVALCAHGGRRARAAPCAARRTGRGSQPARPRRRRRPRPRSSLLRIAGRVPSQGMARESPRAVAPARAVRGGTVRGAHVGGGKGGSQEQAAGARRRRRRDCRVSFSGLLSLRFPAWRPVGSVRLIIGSVVSLASLGS